METVILVVHLIIITTMVLVILLQRSSNDGLSGLGGGSSNPGATPVRGTANPLTKATAILATLFIASSLALAYLANAKNESVIISDKAPKIIESETVPFLAEEEASEELLGGDAVQAETTPSQDVDEKLTAPVVPIAE